MRKMQILVTVGTCLVLGAAVETDAYAQLGAPAPGSSSAPTATPDEPVDEPVDAAVDDSAAPVEDPTASSQPPPEPAPIVTPAADAAARPEAQFVGLDRQDGISRYAVELAYTNVDGGDETFVPLRIGLYGQYLAASGLGGYGSVNITHLNGSGDSATAVSNLEGGVLYLTKLGTTDVVARAGLVLPSASDSDLGDFLANALSTYSRVTDTVLFAPNITWLRASGSPVIRRGTVIFRADVGVDVPINSQGDYQFTPALRLNLAAGLLQGPTTQLSVELVNMVLIGDDQDNQAIHSVGFTYRGSMGKLSPFAGLSKAFSSTDLDLSDIRFTLVAGVGGVFGT